MKRWILANHAEKDGRLYWSAQRGWTSKELASLYLAPERETITPPPNCKEPIWFEVVTSVNGFRYVIERDEERPGIGAEGVLAMTELLARSLQWPGRIPDRVEIHQGYRVNFYRKATT